MRFPTLDAWLRWQEQLHPKAIDLGLGRVGQVWGALRPAGLPFPVITVGGTNGKGSCVAMLESILLSAGYRVGCYTSPHLVRYNERVRIQGREAADSSLCAAFERVDRARGEFSLTYFEIGTLAALDIFAGQALDLVVLEVGLGGRLDAVNILDADVSVVTTIGLDHREWLGDKLEQIAVEKAGIFRPGRPAVIGSAIPRLAERAHEIGACVLELGRDYGWSQTPHGWTWWGLGRRRDGLPWPALRGRHQLDNAAAALMALDCLAEAFPVAQNAVRIGLESVRLPGRFQVLPGQPRIVLDVAHNPQGAESLAANLREFVWSGRLHAVCGLLADKDAAGIAGPLVPFVDTWYLARPRSTRGMDLDRLSQGIRGTGVAGAIQVFGSVADALEVARAGAVKDDTLLVFGSFVTVGEAMHHLGMGNAEVSG